MKEGPGWDVGHHGGWLMVYNLTVKDLLTAASRACVLSALFLPSKCGGERGTHRKALKKRLHFQGLSFPQAPL